MMVCTQEHSETVINNEASIFRSLLKYWDTAPKFEAGGIQDQAGLYRSWRPT